MARSGYKTCSSMYTIIGLAVVICVAAVQAELRQVNVVFRHGDRTPDDNSNEAYPNDPYYNYDFFPEGRGQLINNGKQREYRLGRVLHNRYSKFLGSYYTPNTVFGISSDYDRTKMSLQLVLASLFPPNREQKWNPQLNWQPIPTRYLRRAEDNVFLGDECPLYLQEYERVTNTPEGKRQLSRFDGLMKQLTIWTGKNVTNAFDMYYLYHTLMAEYSDGLILPDWAYEVFPYGELWNGTVLWYETASATTLQRRLNAGPYLRLVTKSMLARVAGTSENIRKIYLYSGHETNVAAVLFALGLYTPHVPGYSSAVILELHEIEDKFFVKVLHYWGIPPKVEELAIPNCDLMCPLDQFLKSIKDVIPSNEELKCNKKSTEQYADTISLEELDVEKYDLIRISKTPDKN
nr:venom acid phosphatase Acph-1-like [Nomia melanderi]XP_031828078.1 venom acid phosphatase Acph-1-like [Nomia melanderi]XP_031828087.1 venom acid phosphatase Acph-1-like [Nomia melanderi]XP_031828093.1 venom acid phosphatase Acph-1-like [Nomia melanderi]